MNPDILKILSGPHEYRNGQYVSLVKTPQQIADEEAAAKAAKDEENAPRTAEVNNYKAKIKESK